MNTQAIVKDYYDACIRRDRERARSYLHDVLEYRSADANFNSAEDFLNVCWPHAEKFTVMEWRQKVYGEDAAYVAYRFNDVLCIELHKSRDGKISEDYVTFNPTV